MIMTNFKGKLLALLHFFGLYRAALSFKLLKNFIGYKFIH